MLKKFRFYAIFIILVNAIALMTMFIITCVHKRKFCWAFLASSVVDLLAGSYLLGQLHFEEHSVRSAEEYLDSEFEAIEHGSVPRRATIETDK